MAPLMAFRGPLARARRLPRPQTPMGHLHALVKALVRTPPGGLRPALGLAATGILATAPAFGLEVTRSKDIEAPPAAVWAIIGDFCGIGRWHPQVERCILSQDEDDETVRVQVRGLVVRGGLGTIVEVETARDDVGMTYSYSFVQGPLPVSAYNASITVRPNGTGSTVIWSAAFDAAGMSDAEAVADITAVYDAGLAGIAKEASR